jgi:hypothetical protein
VTVKQDAEEASTTTSARRMIDLVSHPSKQVRGALAHNPAASDQIILMLAEDSADTVRLSAASAATRRPALHSTLASSDDKWVRGILAYSAAADDANQLPHKVQLTFARDEFVEVRQRVAHTTMYLDVFEILLADSAPMVRGYCASNPRITQSQMDRLVADRSWIVRASSLSGIRSPRDEQIIALATDKSTKVRWCALMRVDTPSQVVDIMLEDPDEMLRNHARLARERSGDAPSKQTLWVRSERERVEALAFR